MGSAVGNAADAAQPFHMASRACALSDLDVLNLAQSIEPDPTRVAAWYRSEPIMTLGGLTQWQIVRAGHIGALVDFLRVIQIEVSE